MNRYWFSALMLASVLANLILACLLPPEAHAAPPPRGRLSRLIRKKPRLYMPTRLIVGEDNRFVVQAPAGSHVVLLMSPKPEGAMAPDGTPLAVGKDFQTLETVTAANGVVELILPIPAQKALRDRVVYVDAYTYQAEDYSDLQRLELTDAAGRASSGSNALLMTHRPEGGGPMVLPGMPGMPVNLMQQLGTLGEMMEGDERKRDLLDEGTMNRDVLRDQNVLAPGVLPQGR